jgi:hypothetical protein
MFKSMFVSISVAIVVAASSVSIARADGDMKDSTATQQTSGKKSDEARAPANQPTMQRDEAVAQDDDSAAEAAHSRFSNARDHRF